MIIIAASNPTINDLKRLMPLMAAGAQRAYDAWDQNDEGEDPELGVGGICQDVAEEISGVLNMNGIEAGTVSQQVGDQHVYTIAKLNDGVYEVDIPPSLYETGGGYVWKKRKGITFNPSMIYVSMISGNPADFEVMTQDF